MTQASSASQLYKRLLKRVLPYKGVFAIAVVGMIVVALGETSFVAAMKPIMDEGFTNHDARFIQWLPLLIILIVLVRGIGQFIDTYCMDWVGRRIVYDLRQEMFDRFVKMPSAYYDDSASAALVSKITFDVEQVARASTTTVRTFIKDSMMAILLLSWMFYLSVQATLAFLLIAPVAIAILAYSSRKFRKTSGSIQDSMGDITTAAKEAFQGHELVKLFNGYGQESKRFAQANNRNRQQSMKRSLVLAISVPMIMLVAGCGLAAIIWFALNSGENDATSAGTFVSYLSATVALMQPLRRLAKVNEQIQTGVAAAESIFDVLDSAPEQETGSEILTQPVAGEIRFDNVHFKYEGSDAPVINGVSFTIAPRQKVALVGASGSGKSTVIKLLLRLYLPQSGQITIDGSDIQALSLEAVRAELAFVPQKASLFDDSLANNICYGSGGIDPAVKAAKIAEAVEAAYLTEFVQQLPNGLDSPVAENGAKLSGGQQQRVAIARALYKNAPILVLDEATSALDSTAEQKIQAAIDNVLNNRTALIVAHRLSTIRNADLILVFDEGTIAEQGTHAELLALKGAYYRLHEAQQGNEA